MKPNSLKKALKLRKGASRPVGYKTAGGYIKTAKGWRKASSGHTHTEKDSADRSPTSGQRTNIASDRLRAAREKVDTAMRTVGGNTMGAARERKAAEAEVEYLQEVARRKAERKKSTTNTFKVNLEKMRKVRLPAEIRQKGIGSAEYKAWVKKNWT